MTIKRKIRLSNIMMVLIPILFTAIVITVCLHTSLGSYWYTLEAMYSDENSIQFAQSMIYTYQKELWENNWGQDGHTDMAEGIRRSDEMNHLENKLSRMGVVLMYRAYWGMEFNPFDKEIWNREQLESPMGKVDAITIAEALKAISENLESMA